MTITTESIRDIVETCHRAALTSARILARQRMRELDRSLLQFGAALEHLRR